MSFREILQDELRLFPKSQLPDEDPLAILLDPAGLSFGIYTPASS
ncbi:MAG: hypothetical protein ACXW5U_12280 [Thermoanaerobaculia bacterium]